MTVEPRWLGRRAVADYLQIGITTIDRRVKAGTLPPPSRHLGPKSPRWDRRALDAMLAPPVASIEPDIDRLVMEATDAIRRRAERKGRPSHAR